MRKLGPIATTIEMTQGSDKKNWGSAHGEGAHFGFADGQVEYIASSVSAAILRAATTPDGRETPQ
jgi:prepilin-type processing-associated H-X9-DG protein